MEEHKSLILDLRLVYICKSVELCVTQKLSFTTLAYIRPVRMSTITKHLQILIININTVHDSDLFLIYSSPYKFFILFFLSRRYFAFRTYFSLINMHQPGIGVFRRPFFRIPSVQ